MTTKELEKTKQNQIFGAIGSISTIRIFRNNTGMAYRGGKIETARRGVLCLKNARPIHFGLCVGSSDLIGFKTVTITPEMVGQKLAVFLAVEVKTAGYKTTPEILKFAEENNELKNNLSAAAHLIHGSSENRFSITYCPGSLTKEEIEGVNFNFADLGSMLKKYNPEMSTFFRLVASEPIRNMATVAGNIINASPIGDLTIMFLALNAEVIIDSSRNSRTIPLKNFFLGYKKLSVKRNEVVKSIEFQLAAKLVV